MSAIAKNIRSMSGMGIFADRNANSPSLQFRRYNLVYGFNGSGKSTLSRLFGSLENGVLHPGLPDGCSFQIRLDDGVDYGCPSNPSGLERRLLVFNSDYIDQNLRWTEGRANPVFFIGANQAEAAAELAETESNITKQLAVKTTAVTTEKTAGRNFVNFKRDRAKNTASRLHLGNRKYEAPALVNDYEAWQLDGGMMLTDEGLRVAEETRRQDEPLSKLTPLAFEASSVETAYQHITEICRQSLTKVALDEVQRFPDMLLWLKQGQEFHEANGLADCLFCGNAISTARKEELAAALDNQVDQFVTKVVKTAERLQVVVSALSTLEGKVPTADVIVAELRPNFKDTRTGLVREVRQAHSLLSSLQGILVQKQERPATPADMSGVAPQADVAAAVRELDRVIEATNAAIAAHNDVVENFAENKNNAELAIRKHFIADCLSEYARQHSEYENAKTELETANAELRRLNDSAELLRQKVREHGPAAGAINKLIASYLGHKELTILPVEQGYELQRYGKPIQGVPSEGEKTAIAITYFLSSIEAEGRKLEDLIIVVDDPVSSLDTNALNFACALLRSRLSGAGQLFILTHNLQCMNEFRKAWKGKAKPPEGKDPTATFLFIDVAIQTDQDKRTSTVVEMSRLLREYDSEYHFLFSHILKFTENPNAYDDHGYMIPNVLRRVLDVFLAFKCPGSSGLVGQLQKLCADFPDLDRDRLTALERLAQVESHSDNLDDLISFSSMTLEETRAAAVTLLEVMGFVDGKHLTNLKRLCR